MEPNGPDSGSAPVVPPSPQAAPRTAPSPGVPEAALSPGDSSSSSAAKPSPPRNCPECGSQAEGEFTFCIKCGAELDSKETDTEYMKMRQESAMLKVLTVVVIGLILFAMLFGFFLPRMLGPDYRKYPTETQFSVDFVIDFQSGSEKHYSIDMPLASNLSSDGTAYQTVAVDGISAGYSLSHNRYGSGWLYWNGTLQADKKLSVKVSYRATVKLMHWTLNESALGDTGDVPLKMMPLLNDEWRMRTDGGLILDRDGDSTQDIMIQPSSPIILNKTREIVRNLTTGFEMAKAISRWITDNIRYPTQSQINANLSKTDEKPRHALWVLRDRLGDCDEQTALFLSMARSVGLPAWFSFGALYSPGTQEWGGHAWATVYIPYRNGTGVELAADTTNDEFAVLDPYHMTVWQDRECSEKALLDYYSYLEYSPGDPPAFASERYELKSFATSGEYVKIYDEAAEKSTGVPGFEFLALVPAVFVALAAFTYFHRKRI